jgi:hypothetical protein
MYTDKTVPQTMSAINARLHVPGTKSKPQLDGWVDKNGKFAIGVITDLRWRFRRKTYLRGQARREQGVTIIRGTVPSGLSREGQLAIFGILLVIGLVTLTQGNAMLAIIAVVAGAAFYIPLHGDYVNSEILLGELQKTIKGRFTPPKQSKSTAKKAQTR